MTYKIIPDSDRVMKYVTAVWDAVEDGIAAEVTPIKGGVVLPKGAIIVDHTLETIEAASVVSLSPQPTLAIKVGGTQITTTPLNLLDWYQTVDVNILPTTNGKVMASDRAVKFAFANSSNFTGGRLAVTIGYLDSSNATAGL